MKRGKNYKLHKECFVNGHCTYDCPNFRCDEIENYYDIPCEDAGLCRIPCKECYLNSFECRDCLFNKTEMCHKNRGVRN